MLVVTAIRSHDSGKCIIHHMSTQLRPAKLACELINQGLLPHADLNHVIHACTHPSWRDLPYYSEDEMMEQLERQVERIFDLVR